MAIDIHTISDSVLFKDLLEGVHDLGVCETALVAGIAQYHGKSVEKRIAGNKQINATICKELKRRYPSLFETEEEHAKE